MLLTSFLFSVPGNPGLARPAPEDLETMRHRVVATALVATMSLAVLAAIAPPSALALPKWTAYDRPARHTVVTERDVPIVMRDGTTLSANVARPAAPGRYPVLVTQTPYGKEGPTGLVLGGSATYMVVRGYVHVTVDVRGTGASQGQWDSFGETEQRDGYDVVEWAAKQPFSDGSVGLTGPSYMGLNQLFTAAQRPPHLKAIFPIVPMADGYRDIAFSGGDINASFIPLWLGLVTAGSLTPPPHTVDGTLDGLVRGLTTLGSHVSGVVNFQAGTLLGAATGGSVAYDGPFWKVRSPIEVVNRIRVPAFVVGGHHDLFQRGEPLIYERLKNRVPAHLLMGPWTHLGGSTGAGLPRDGVPSLNQIQLRWFDRWLKGIDTDPEKMPRVTQYTYGREHYEVQADWPEPKLDPKPMFLRGGGALDTKRPTTDEPAQSFIWHPLSGICTMSTGQWTAGLGEQLPCMTDERPNELAGGITYTTPPLTKAMRLNGPVAARLYLTTTASDAAVTVRLASVDPTGQTTGLTTGWQTASFRARDRSRERVVRGNLVQPWHPFTRESVQPVIFGAATRLDVEIFPVNAVIPKGHRLKVTIDPADFPHQIPPLPALLNRLGGRVSVLTGPNHRSMVMLPITGSTCAVPKADGTCAPLPVPRLIRG
jgi:putative CocE/NonD family hydrolase